MDDNDDYEVGYRKPPKANRFKKGQSGNAKGRPPKPKVDRSRDSLADILERAGNREIEVNGETMTLREVEILSIQTKAAKGDISAARHLASLRREAGLNKEPSRCGVLVVPGIASLEEWEASAAIQQAKFRGEDPEGLAELERPYEHILNPRKPDDG